MTALRPFLFGLCLGGAAALAVAATDDIQPIPQLSERVTDQTGTLDAEQKLMLESELAALEQRKGSQIVVLIVQTTQPEDIAQYAIRVFDQWKLGRKGVNDGLLLLVAKDDHRMRIEVGRGLEGAIPDAATARILRDYVKPKFRDGDFFGGIHDATGALIKLVDGEALPSADESSKSNIKYRYDKDIVGNPLFIVFVLVMLSIVLRLLLFFLPTLIGGLIAGGASAAGAWYWMQAMDWTTLPSFFTACVSFLLGLILCPQPGGRYARGSGAGSFDSGSGFSSSSSSDSGSSSSSDSVSGGGGDSAGGGSSDSW